jgi:hypothetical protein
MYAKSFFSKMMCDKNFVARNADMIFTTERGRNKAILDANEADARTDTQESKGTLASRNVSIRSLDQNEALA